MNLDLGGSIQHSTIINRVLKLDITFSACDKIGWVVFPDVVCDFPEEAFTNKFCFTTNKFCFTIMAQTPPFCGLMEKQDLDMDTDTGMDVDLLKTVAWSQIWPP